MAHVSAQISHDHIVTAFHFLISNRTALPPASSLPPSSTFSSTSIFFSSAIINFSLKILKDQLNQTIEHAINREISRRLCFSCCFLLQAIWEGLVQRGLTIPSKPVNSITCFLNARNGAGTAIT
jgi:hypothetical protein